MLIEPFILLFFLFVLALLHPGRIDASLNPPQHLFRLLKMDTELSNNLLSRNSDILDHHHNNRHRQHQRHRPSPSDLLPIDDLLESNNPIYDPQPEDIDIKTLRRQLGRAYDKRYMAVYTPNQKKQRRQFSIQLKKGRPAFGSRPAFLKRLRSARLQDGRKIRLNVSKKDRRKFQKYIWSLTFCPVRHTWKYLGIRFWPQWIKQGSCSSEQSCSIPEGMRCKPSDSTNLTFLRWHCADFKSRKACKWIPIQYPIITACSCKC